MRRPVDSVVDCGDCSVAENWLGKGEGGRSRRRPIGSGDNNMQGKSKQLVNDDRESSLGLILKRF